MRWGEYVSGPGSYPIATGAGDPARLAASTRQLQTLRSAGRSPSPPPRLGAHEIDRRPASVPEAAHRRDARHSFLLSWSGKLPETRARRGEWTRHSGVVPRVGASPAWRPHGPPGLARAGPGAMSPSTSAPAAVRRTPCTLRPSHEAQLRPIHRPPRSNTPESRSSLYLDQVACVHQARRAALSIPPTAPRRLVIVHGDHGSRIGLAPAGSSPDLRPPTTWTLLGARRAAPRRAVTSGDGCILELLLAMAIGRTDALPDQAPPPPPRVYLSRGLIHYVPRPIPIS
jgi:hypothetical protein